MLSNDDYLYIFLHIPKTAGTTFNRHVEYNLPYRSIIRIAPGPFRKLECKADVDDYIDSLDDGRKERTRIICGHGAYYGIHEHFDREPRYFTFLRDPVRRAISAYNFTLENYDLVEDDERFPTRKEDLTFDRWWETCVQKNLQLGVVLNFRVDDKPGWHPELRFDDTHLQEAKDILRKFHFVGLTESFGVDSAYLYEKLDIRRLLKNRQNVTKEKYFEGDKHTRERIRSEAMLDMKFYEYGVALNREFKKSAPNFSEVVDRVREEGRYVVPVRFALAGALHSLIGARRTAIVLEKTVRTVKSVTGIGD